MGGSKSKQTPTDDSSKKLDKPWRNFDWEQKDRLKERLEKFQLSSPDLNCVKLLVAGQIGAGKSSFINSVNSAFQGQIVCDAQADAQSAASHSYTKKLEGYRIKNADADLPFEICDVMGLEPQELSGLQPEDVVKIIHGHVKEGYKFTENPITSKSESYNEIPSLSDQAFCLVYVVDANTIQLKSDDTTLLKKLRLIRKKLTDEGIPQVIVLTKVDEACKLVESNLKDIYYSITIKKKMEFCSAEIGVPMTMIFPVKNYHNEVDTDDSVDALILKAFDQIVRSANARLSRGSSNE
ncbi:interferon-induced protein 44-like [Danio rerio]|uniref:Interferon-induced protein 44-like n=1 Tax=Danio rerio TaxID=7955 RepID=E7F125_DANRE|nr:interferon-induced protein 44-like [Danio rerio]|eukprot:XP_009304423.1 interferon-induced protein 44-like [Danio rerio]